MKPNRACLGALLCAGLMTGCVERRFVITTDPPYAAVYDEKGLPMGASPADRQFTYYGKYRFTLVRDGYQTMIIEEKVKAPWYEIAPLDFISENVIPWTIRDVRHFHYELQPAQLVAPDTVLRQAEERRRQGQGIGVPLPRAPGGPLPELGPPQPLMPPAGNVTP